jgi:hypothetical protein
VKQVILPAICLATAVLALGCGDDDDQPAEAVDERSDELVEDEIRDDLEGLADALAAGNYDRIYSDFLTAECQSLVSREAYLQTLERSREQLESQRIQIDNVVLLSRDGGPEEAEVRVDFTLLQDGQAIPRDPQQPPAQHRGRCLRRWPLALARVLRPRVRADGNAVRRAASIIQAHYAGVPNVCTRHRGR